MDRKYWQSFQMQTKRTCVFGYLHGEKRLCSSFRIILSSPSSILTQRICSEARIIPCSWAGMKDAEISPEQLLLPGFTEALLSHLAQLSPRELSC